MDLMIKNQRIKRHFIEIQKLSTDKVPGLCRV